MKQLLRLADEWWVSGQDVFAGACHYASREMGQAVDDRSLSHGARFAFQRFAKARPPLGKVRQS